MHISSSEFQDEKNLLQEMFIITCNTLWRALIKNNNKNPLSLKKIKERKK